MRTCSSAWKSQCEQEIEQVLEAKVAETDVTELKQDNVQALVEKGMLKAV